MSADGRFRLRLTRRWSTNTHGHMVAWVMLNPSTADFAEDDHTVRKVVGFAREWGCAGVHVVNLSPLRSTDPSALVGWNPTETERAETIRYIDQAVRSSYQTIVAWGANAAKYPAVAQIANYVRTRTWDLFCLGTNSDGSPKHPLMLPYETRVRRWPR